MAIGIGIVGSGFMSRTYAFGIHELVEGGEIGQIRMVRHTYAHTLGSFATPDHWILDPRSGSPFVDQGAHCNDAIRWFVGADATQVFARYESYSGAPPPGQSAMVD